MRLSFVSITLVLAFAVAGSGAVFEEVGGKVAMEAEHATTNSGWKAITGGMEDGGSGGLTFKITFKTTGKYFVWVRGAAGPNGCPPSTAANDCWIKFDGNYMKIEGYSGPDIAGGLRWSNSGCKNMQWQQGLKPLSGASDWDQIKGLPVYVNVSSAGEHTFSILHRAAGVWIDRACLMLNQSSKPSGIGPAETVKGGSTVVAPRAMPINSLSMIPTMLQLYTLDGSRVSGRASNVHRGIMLMSTGSGLKVELLTNCR